jgi:hypothetical protein
MISVDVKFDWSLHPDADPIAMLVYFFPEGGGSSLRYAITNREGGTLRLPVGNYDVLCVNSDTETVRLVGTEYKSTFEITTHSTTLLASLSALGMRSDELPKADGTSDERIASVPDKVWSHHRQGIELLRDIQNDPIVLTPAAAHSTYTVDITEAENLSYSRGISGSLSGLAGGIYACNGGSTTAENVIMPFEVTITETEDAVHGTFLTFGDCGMDDKPHKLTIYSVMSDGSKWYYTYDVTDQVENAPDPRNVHIQLSGLPLPKPVQGGGFQPEVEDWEDPEYIDIIM